MVLKKRGQAAFEYLSTYGWAIMTAMVAIGALAYFGFLNPSNLLPNKCDFGKQLECSDFQARYDAAGFNTYDLYLKNNFGKDINITKISLINANIMTGSGNTPLIIKAGSSEQLQFRKTPVHPKGEKDSITVIITFKRAGGNYPTHNITGTVFTAMK